MANDTSSKQLVGSLKLDQIINTKYGVSEGSPLRLDSDNNFSIDSDSLISGLNLMTMVDDTCTVSGVAPMMVKGVDSIAYSDGAIANGASCQAGTRVFRVISGDSDLNTWKLSSVEGIEAGMDYSIRLYYNYNFAGRVLDVDAENCMISTTPFPNIPVEEDYTVRPFTEMSNVISCVIDLSEKSDTFGLWIIGHPELGDIAADDEFQTVIGLKNFAAKDNSLAIGALNVADGKYSVAEGLGTRAGYASHSEGVYTSAIGQRSHAEGELTLAYGSRSHAEGYQTSAIGNVSHSEGQNCIARGNASHVEGLSSFAEGKVSHAEGNATSAYGEYSHTEGQQTRVGSGTGSHAEGFKTYALSDYSHAEGNATSAFGKASHAEGQSTYVEGAYSHAEGETNNIFGNYSHAEGSKNIISGQCSHAEGQQNIVLANYSHAGGLSSYIGKNATWSFVQGTKCSADANHTIALGRGAKNTHEASFIWSGYEDSNHKTIDSSSFHAYGKRIYLYARDRFDIDLASANNNINNVYIGGKSLNEWIDSKISALILSCNDFQNRITTLESQLSGISPRLDEILA